MPTIADRLLLAAARPEPDVESGAVVAALLHATLDWRDVLERAAREGVGPLLHAHLSSSDNRPGGSIVARTLTAGTPVPAGVPGGVLGSLADAYRRSWGRNVALTAAWADVMGRLGAAGVSAITLKGMMLAHTVYRDVGLRPMADLDLLVRPRDVETARHALEAIGYRGPGDEEAREEASRGYLHLVREGTVIDLHWELAHYSRFEGIVRVDPEALWRHAVPLTIEGVEGRALGTEHLLLHLALHLTLGSEFGRLIWFSDIDAVVRRASAALDWGWLVDEARRWRAAAVLGYCLGVARASLGTPVPRDVLVRLGPRRLSRILLRGCLGDVERPPTLARPVPDTAAYLAEALLMDRARHTLAVLLTSVFPSRTWLGFHYAITSRWQLAAWRLLHPFRVVYLAARHLR